MPVLYSPDGIRYSTDVPVEVVRLRAAGYTDSPERPPTLDEERFHPGDYSVADVQTYIANHPDDADRVIAEEKAGKARVTIIGDSGSGDGDVG